MIKYKIISAAFLICCAYFVNAQQRGNIWCFGDSAGIDFNIITNPVPIVSGIDSRGSCVTISDTTGTLLFLAAGCPEKVQIGNLLSGKIYDKFGQVMAGGDSIVTGAWYNELVIVPDPSSVNLYYVFSAGVTGIYGFYFSKVDITQGSGLGSVTQKNVQLQNFANADCLNAIKHGNGRDWWVFFRRWNPANPFPGNNEFHSYIVSPSGITNYTIQQIGSLSYTGLGKLTFSQQGDKLAFVTYAGLVEIYDFDRCTGLISNPVNLFQETSSGSVNHFWGCEFSPNGNVLYVTISDQTSYLFQFDLTAPNIAASIDTLWQTSFPGEAIGGLKRGPDGKIYESGPYTNPSIFVYPYPDSMRNMYNENLGVINFPDSIGAACNFLPYSFYLGGKRTYWGLPNNPDYDMPALTGSPCDTITSIAIPAPQTLSPQLFVTYTHDWQKLFINAQNLKGKIITLTIYDATGKLIYIKERSNALSGYYTHDINCSNFTNGVYVVNLVAEKEKLSKKFSVVK